MDTLKKDTQLTQLRRITFLFWVKKLKLFGPEQVTINDEVHNLQEILNTKKEKLKPGESIVEAKMRIYVTGDIPHANLENYLQRFMDYKIKTLDMSSWINLDKRHVSVPMMNKEYDVGREISYDFVSDVRSEVRKNHPTLRWLWQLLTSPPFKNKKGTAFDQVSKLALVQENSEPDSAGRRTHTVVFGCSGDCQPTLQFSSRDEDYQEFVDFFSTLDDVAIRAGVCWKRRTPKTQHIPSKYIPIEGHQDIEECVL